MRIEVLDGRRVQSYEFVRGGYHRRKRRCGRYWNESNSTYRAAGYYGSLDMLRKLPELLGLGCYLVQDDRTRRKLDPTEPLPF